MLEIDSPGRRGRGRWPGATHPGGCPHCITAVQWLFANPRATLLNIRTGTPVGYVPDWLVDVVHELRSLDAEIDATAEHVNPATAPPHMRLLYQLLAPWPDGYEPLSGPEDPPIAQPSRSIAQRDGAPDEGDVPRLNPELLTMPVAPDPLVGSVGPRSRGGLERLRGSRLGRARRPDHGDLRQHLRPVDGATAFNADSRLDPCCCCRAGRPLRFQRPAVTSRP